jgi:hypothetical protein
MPWDVAGRRIAQTGQESSAGTQSVPRTSETAKKAERLSNRQMLINMSYNPEDVDLFFKNHSHLRKAMDQDYVFDKMADFKMKVLDPLYTRETKDFKSQFYRLMQRHGKDKVWVDALYEMITDDDKQDTSNEGVSNTIRKYRHLTSGQSMVYMPSHGYAAGAPFQHAPAYAAVGCHPMTNAAPVGCADAHSMAYAAARCHPMAYAAPVGYADGHPLTCAAPTCHGGACAADAGDNSFRHSKIDYRIEFRDDGVCLLHKDGREVYCGRDAIALVMRVSKNDVHLSIEYPNNDTKLEKEVSWGLVIDLAKWYYRLHAKQQALVQCTFSCDEEVKNEHVKRAFNTP